jgi:hypothetical protein
MTETLEELQAMLAEVNQMQAELTAKIRAKRDVKARFHKIETVEELQQIAKLFGELLRHPALSDYQRGRICMMAGRLGWWDADLFPKHITELAGITQDVLEKSLASYGISKSSATHSTYGNVRIIAIRSGLQSYPGVLKEVTEWVRDNPIRKS